MPLVCQLIALAAVGRVVLSLLPPGRPGAHEWHALPATWAASHALGVVAIGAQVALTATALSDAVFAHVAPWLLVGAVRAALLPGALVPRYDTFARGTTPWRRVRSWLLAAFVVAALVRSLVFDAGIGGAHGAALAILTLDALDGARRHAVGGVVALASLTLAPIDERTFLLGVGAAAAVRWWRHADARAGWSATLAFAATALTGAGAAPRVLLPGALALAILVAVSAGPARARALVRVGVLAAVVLLVRVLGGPRAESAAAVGELWRISPVGSLSAPIAVLMGAARARTARERIDPPRREFVGILALTAGTIAACLALGDSTGVALGPLALLAGLGLASGDERG